MKMGDTLPASDHFQNEVYQKYWQTKTIIFHNVASIHYPCFLNVFLDDKYVLTPMHVLKLERLHRKFDNTWPRLDYR